jgi:hypothetical protein
MDLEQILCITGIFIFITAVVALGIWISRENVGADLFRTNASELIYQKDLRTGICFAQGSKLLATVPCNEAVERLIRK